MPRRTTKEFIKLAEKAHGNTYDYSLVMYTTQYDKIKIICKEHGEYLQAPYAHLRGQGCPLCAKNRKVSPEDFIIRCEIVHGTRYDYSRVEYLSMKKKVEVVCKEHGAFLVRPSDHLSGNGCPLCNGGIRSTRNQFLEKAMKIHGRKYDYSKVNYLNNKTDVHIICREHGSFWQTAGNHLSGYGCPKCGAAGRKTGLDEFIKRARDVHGHKYDYSGVDYLSDKEKVDIRCPKHGSFLQAPANHVRLSQGCPECAGVKRLDTNEFIRKAVEVHGKKYGYSRADYINYTTKVEINCQHHGTFYQAPACHLSGRGCPECANAVRGYGTSGFYGSMETTYLYFICLEQEDNFKWLKIGLSKHPERRFKELEWAIPNTRIEVLQIWEGPARTLYVEGEIQILFYSGLEKIKNNNWSWGGKTECFTYSHKECLGNLIYSLLSHKENVYRIV